ncbi:MAG: RagB/SusD family nutrient uptake outer membrane protein [Prevotella sp.]|nr:RagB/SusD family nutrient uptake outer membrane protein [Prevotella sp.]
MMKSSIKIFLLAGLVCCGSVATLTSCSSWIEEETEGQTTDATLGDNDEAAQAWVTGVYSKWVYDMFCWGYFPKVLELDADYISGPSWLFKAFGAGNFEGESEVCDALWKGCYGLIERADYAQKQIEKMTSLTDAAKQNYLGELKFHKAMAYFLLVRAYGAIPLAADDVDKTNNPRVAVDKVYDEIFTLLEESASQLYKNTDANYQIGHVNAGSAAGLLAKAYATAAASALGQTNTYINIRTGAPYIKSGDTYAYAKPYCHKLQVQTVSGYENINPTLYYQKASVWANKVLNTTTLGTYEMSTYDNLWKMSNRYASEFLFAVYTPSADTKYKTSIHTNYEGVFTDASCEYIADGGWIGCTYNWYQLFEPTDRRIIDGVKHRIRSEGQKQPLDDGSGMQGGLYYPADDYYKNLAENHLPPFDQPNVKYWTFSGTPSDQYLAFTTKYMEVSDPTTGNADSPWPFLRIADVWLIYAEASNETGDPTAALAALGKVQQRSDPSLTTAPTAADLHTRLDSNNELTDQEVIRSAIIEERAKELACEGDRRWDLIRFGIYLQAMNAIGGNDDAGVSKSRLSRNLLFPLPAQELNTNRAINENNPGWR